MEFQHTSPTLIPASLCTCYALLKKCLDFWLEENRLLCFYNMTCGFPVLCIYEIVHSLHHLVRDAALPSISCLTKRDPLTHSLKNLLQLFSVTPCGVLR